MERLLCAFCKFGCQRSLAHVTHVSHSICPFQYRLFFSVGVGGYLYSYSDTRDNILLNFPLSVKPVLVGRIGYSFTIFFGMPLVFLPCRGAILSLPAQIREWREAVHNAHGEDKAMALHDMMKGTKHHIPNGVTFDEECPLLMEQQTKRKVNRQITPPEDSEGTVSTVNSGDDSYETFVVTTLTPVPTVDPAIQEDASTDQRIHVGSTIGILVSTYVMAVGVPGVGVVWSIAGSSMAIIIGFIIPCACYLKIRSKKSINPRSIGAFLLLLFSILSSVVCTVRTIGDLYR